MTLQYTPYAQAKPIRNEWHLAIHYMFGDADGYTTETYTFKKEEHFLLVYTFFKKWFDFKKNNHNACIDLWDRQESKDQFLASQKEYTKYGDEQKKRYAELEAAVNQLLGDHASMYEMRDAIQKKIKNDIDIPSDPSSDGQYYGSLESIEDMVYYDDTGAKFKIQVTA